MPPETFPGWKRLGAFGDDVDLEDMIYVDEMTTTEAKTLLTKLLTVLSQASPGCPTVTLTDLQMEYVFKNIGTNPLLLQRLAYDLFGGDVKSVEEFVERRLSHARHTLEICHHKAILKALKDHPEGVVPEAFFGQESDGIALNDAVSMMTSHWDTIVYRMDLVPRVYQLPSTALRTALKSYSP